MNKLRIIAAFLIAPLMTPATMVLATTLRGNPLSSARDLGVVFVIYVPFAYLAVIIFGVPLFFLFRFLRISGVFAHLTAGTIIGLIVAVFLFRIGITWRVASGDYAWCALAGCMSALLFWLVAYGFVEPRMRVKTNSET